MQSTEIHGVGRRGFVLASGVAGFGQILGANDRFRGGIIGSGSRGRYLTGEFKEIGVEMAAVCDVYEPNLAEGLKVANSGAKAYDNYRRLLDDKSIDVVIVATPDHWHAQMTIDAVKAGKDVYVEKPMAHTIDEGFAVIKAVRETGRVVQVGTQRRSFDLFIEARKLVDTGVLGDVHLVTSQWMSYQEDFPQRSLEGKLDWKQWLGSAPARVLDPARFFGWYYYWDYSGGLLVGQAAHIVDAINWFMNSGVPLAVSCTGGKPHVKGVEVPETAVICIEYPEDYVATFTLGYRSMRYNSFNDQIEQFHGTKARFDIGREWYALYPQSNAIEMKPSVEKKLPGSFWPAARAHIRNFLDCVQSRKDPNATVEMGQNTNIVLAMAMDSLRSGRRIRYNPVSRKTES